MNKNGCLIGLDAGASLTKAVAFDLAGHEICVREVPFAPVQAHPLWFENDMNAVWETAKQCIAHVAKEVSDRYEILGIGITATGDGTFMMDSGGNPVRNALLWCDGRAGEQVERWHADGTAKKAFAICGTSVFTGTQAVQLAWLREHDPGSLAKAAWIFHAKDWFFYKLTGLITSDETDESLVMLRMSTRQYDPELFRIFGIEDLFSKFPKVLPNEKNLGTVLPALASELGLPKDLPIGSGPMDVSACALGTGAVQHGQASSILGTAAIHEVIMDRPILEPELVGMTLCHGAPNRWMRMIAAMTATPTLEWFVSEIGLGDSSEGNVYSRAESLVKDVPAGSEGVMFHPYLFPGGERGPFVKPAARASFTGLSLHHGRKHLLKSVYEGVAFSMLDCYRHIPIEPSVIFLSGGGANSETWCQIVSDCMGKPVQVPEGSQFGAKGAAMSLGVGLGVYKDIEDAVAQTVRKARSYTPNTANTAVYAALYDIYRDTREGQMELWDRRAAILNKEGKK